MTNDGIGDIGPSFVDFDIFVRMRIWTAFSNGEVGVQQQDSLFAPIRQIFVGNIDLINFILKVFLNFFRWRNKTRD